MNAPRYQTNIGRDRQLEPHEVEAWNEYHRIFEENPALNMYDRVSIHNAFPEIKEAFDRAAAVTAATRTYILLKEDYNETD